VRRVTRVPTRPVAFRHPRHGVFASRCESAARFAPGEGRPCGPDPMGRTGPCASSAVAGSAALLGSAGNGRSRGPWIWGHPWPCFQGAGRLHVKDGCAFHVPSQVGARILPTSAPGGTNVRPSGAPVFLRPALPPCKRRGRHGGEEPALPRPRPCRPCPRLPGAPAGVARKPPLFASPAGARRLDRRSRPGAHSRRPHGCSWKRWTVSLREISAFSIAHSARPSQSPQLRRAGLFTRIAVAGLAIGWRRLGAATCCPSWR
jgi:hypothetical protein